MKYLKILVLASVILITGMYGWYLLASAVNKSADQAATVIIQDTLASSNAYEIRILREIKKLISEGKAVDASALADGLIEKKLLMLEQCVTKQCNETKKTAL